MNIWKKKNPLSAPSDNKRVNCIYKYASNQNNSKLMVHCNNSHLWYLLSSGTIILMIGIGFPKAFSVGSLFHGPGGGYTWTCYLTAFMSPPCSMNSLKLFRWAGKEIGQIKRCAFIACCLFLYHTHCKISNWGDWVCGFQCGSDISCVTWPKF